MCNVIARLVVLSLVGTAAAGCIDVVESSPEAVWVKRPLIAFGSVEGTAEAECETYGRRAVYQGVLEHRYGPSPGSAAAASGTKTVYVPVYAYNCE